jgi:hypothetical protein
MRTLFDDEILEGSPEWIDQEWERMERENPDQSIGLREELEPLPPAHSVPSPLVTPVPSRPFGTASGSAPIILSEVKTVNKKTPTLEKINVHPHRSRTIPNVRTIKKSAEIRKSVL